MTGPPGMSHPKDRSGLTRGQLLRGAAAAAAGVGVAGGLAACENTTEPLAVGCEPGDTRPAADSPRDSSVPKPSGPGGPPAAPQRTTASTWAIADQNPPIPDGLPSGDRRRRSRSSTTPTTSDPALVKKFRKEFDCEVKIGDVQLGSDEAIAKLHSGEVVEYDVIIGLSARA